MSVLYGRGYWHQGLVSLRGYWHQCFEIEFLFLSFFTIYLTLVALITNWQKAHKKLHKAASSMKYVALFEIVEGTKFFLLVKDF